MFLVNFLAMGALRSARLWLVLLAIDVARGFRGGPTLSAAAARPGCRSRPVSARTLLCAAPGAVSAPKTLRLATGVDMQYQTVGALDELDKSPVVFIHGSFHGGWCWAESWMSLFAQRGFPCFAVSLRGTSATPQVGDATSVQLQEHVDDIASFVELAVPSSRPPILLGHSFGGMVAD
jgi:predicted alpha/beta-fold hydrolase